MIRSGNNRHEQSEFRSEWASIRADRDSRSVGDTPRPFCGLARARCGTMRRFDAPLVTISPPHTRQFCHWDMAVHREAATARDGCRMVWKHPRHISTYRDFRSPFPKPFRPAGQSHAV